MSNVKIVLNRNKEIRGKEFKKDQILCTCNMEREINSKDLLKAIQLQEVEILDIDEKSKEEKKEEKKSDDISRPSKTR